MTSGLYNCIIVLAIVLSECSFVGNGIATKNFLKLHPPNANEKRVDDIPKNGKKQGAEIRKEVGKGELYLSSQKEKTCTNFPSTQFRNSGSYKVQTPLSKKNDFDRHLKQPFFRPCVPRRYLPDKTSPGDILDKPLTIPSDIFETPPMPSVKHGSSSMVQRDNHNRDVTMMIIIVVVIIVIVLVAGLVLIFCINRVYESSSNEKQTDDKAHLKFFSANPTGTSTSPKNKDMGRNTSMKNSSLNGTGLHGTEDVSKTNGDGNVQSSEENPPKPAPPPPPPAAPPPPPPKQKPAPPPPPKGGRAPPAPPGARKNQGKTSGEGGDSGDFDAKKTKMKPFFWDKMAGNGNQSMVWDEIRGGSFVFNEEMMESLFGYNSDDKRPGDRRGRPLEASQPQYIQIIEPKKAQNLSILLKALNVNTEEVRDALLEGNELPADLLQTLVRMAPTQEEELKLRLYNGSLDQLGPADRFLKIMVEIPFAFKRMESLAFMMTFKEEVSSIKEAFITLEAACDELKESRLFLKLLEAVLKTGNRMNDGTYRGGAQAFKLDTLLKLADVKGTDGKTTLLHFVVQEIIRTEGMKALRAKMENRRTLSIKSTDSVEYPSYNSESENYRNLGLEVVSSISREIGHVKKAAVIEGDVLTSTVSKLGQSLVKIKEFITNETLDNDGEESGFLKATTSFIEHSEVDVSWLQEEEKRIAAMVKKTTDYFHGHSGKDEGLRLFVIVRDFLILLDRICIELKKTFAMQTRAPSKEIFPRTLGQNQKQSLKDMRERLFPTIESKHGDESSSSDSDTDDDDDLKKSSSKKTHASSKEISPETSAKTQQPKSIPATSSKGVDESSLDLDDDSKIKKSSSKETQILNKEMSTRSPGKPQQKSTEEMRQRVLPVIAAKHADDSSSSDSDDDSD